MKRGMEFRRVMMIMVVVRARFMVMIVFRLMSMIGMRMVGFMGLFMCREAAAGLPLSGTDGGILGFCARRCGWFIFFHRSLLIQFDLPAGRCDDALASSTLGERACYRFAQRLGSWVWLVVFRSLVMLGDDVQSASGILPEELTFYLSQLQGS